MNGLIMCSLVALNIFSAPAGNTVVGEVPAYQRVYLMDGSLLRDWVFIGKPAESGVSRAVGLSILVSASVSDRLRQESSPLRIAAELRLLSKDPGLKCVWCPTEGGPNVEYLVCAGRLAGHHASLLSPATPPQRSACSSTGAVRCLLRV